MAASQPWPQAVADGGGRGNRRWQMAADGAGWQWTTAKGGSLAVDGGGGVDDGSGSGWRQRKTLNVWVVVTKCFYFARDLPVSSFFCPRICPWLPPKQFANAGLSSL